MRFSPKAPRGGPGSGAAGANRGSARRDRHRRLCRDRRRQGVGLSVAAEVELFGLDGAFDGTLEDGSRNLSSLPEDDAGSTDVDGNEFHPRSDSGRWGEDSGNASPAEV